MWALQNWHGLEFLLEASIDALLSLDGHRLSSHYLLDMVVA